VQFISAQRITVVRPNQYQSNRIMNRKLMAVKGRQAKLRDPHVSCASVDSVVKFVEHIR